MYREYSLLEIGKPNSIGNIYDREGVEKILEIFHDKGSLSGEFVETRTGERDSILSKTHDIHHMYVEDDFLVIVVKFMDTKNGRIAERAFSEGEAVFRPTIRGKINYDTQIIKVIDVISIDLISINDRITSPDISWKKLK